MYHKTTKLRGMHSDKVCGRHNSLVSRLYQALVWLLLTQSTGTMPKFWNSSNILPMITYPSSCDMVHDASSFKKWIIPAFVGKYV